MINLFLRGSCRTRIGADDVLSKTNALMDCRWFSPTCKRALKMRLDFMLFCGLDLFAPAPDETANCRFRNPR
ncbi:MAG: transposase [Rhodobacteraceae bacterium]|nr:transposase [Paracoccaceae bacterium]